MHFVRENPSVPVLGIAIALLAGSLSRELPPVNLAQENCKVLIQ